MVEKKVAVLAISKADLKVCTWVLGKVGVKASMMEGM
jgi:hypothetical protein